MRRHLVAQMQRRIEARLAPIVVVRGPRQIGKTTAQLQLLQDLLEQGVPAKNILRVQYDELPEIGKLTEPIDGFAQAFWDTVRDQVAGKAIEMRRQGFVGAAMLPMAELEYTGIAEKLSALDQRFRVRAAEPVHAP